MKKTEKYRKFEQRVGALSGYIKAVASKYLDDKCAVDDVSQLVLLKAWSRIDHLPRFDEQLKYWLRTTTKRAAVDYSRLTGRQKLGEHRSARIDISGSCVDYGGGALAPLSVCETPCLSDPFVVSAIDKFLEDLSCTHRGVLLLFLQGMSYSEIATETSASIGTVRSRLHYARKKAKRGLASYL